MHLFKSAEQLHSHLLQQKKSGYNIGFVPTMGALHQGHLSLIQESKKKSDITVCSIFVNPTQFNNPDDFKHYPITIEKDIEQLISVDCDILFLPSVEEIYPSEHQKKVYALGEVEQVLEGTHRPGHFQGVCQVVDRLLETVAPHKLFMGQKDYQQCMVIAKLLVLLHKENEIQLRVQPTLRENDGLAMSSRNLRLNAEQRQKAVTVSTCLNYIKENFSATPVDQLIKEVTDRLVSKGFDVDYVAISDQQTLQPISTTQTPAVALIAASLGSIRLIDNMLLN